MFYTPVIQEIPYMESLICWVFGHLGLDHINQNSRQPGFLPLQLQWHHAIEIFSRVKARSTAKERSLRT